MIQHGNMMQLLLWHALSTLKDSLKEKAGRFPFLLAVEPDPEDSDRKAHLTVDDCGICQTHTNMAKYCTVWSVCSIDIYWLHSRSPVVLDLWVPDILSFQRDERHEGSIAFQLAPESFHHSLPGRAKISDTMWHPHTQRSQRQKKEKLIWTICRTLRSRCMSRYRCSSCKSWHRAKGHWNILLHLKHS